MAIRKSGKRQAKKRAKKKVANKKVAKKKVARRRLSKTPLLAQARRLGIGDKRVFVKKAKEYVITLTSDDLGVSAMPTLSRSGRDLVQWRNDSSVERRLTFNQKRWPFEDFPCEIVVPKDGTTGWYRTERRDNETGKVHYSYESDPPFSLGGPPGDPVIDTDG